MSATRFKADENVPHTVVELLREGGRDVHTVIEEALGGAPDGGVAAAAAAEGRCVLTLDLDFADIRVFVPGQDPGVVVLRAGSQAVAAVVHVAGVLLRALESKDVGRDLWIVEPDRIRVRETPG